MNYLLEIASFDQLRQSWGHVKRKRKVTPGIDDVSIEDFDNSWKGNIKFISKQLTEDKYTFNKVVQRHILKKRGKSEKRPIRLYCVRDKVVQTSLRITLEKKRGDGQTLFPEIQNSISIGFLDKQYFKGDAVGVKLAIKRVRDLYKNGYKHFINFDIKDFFENVKRDELDTILSSRLMPDDKLARLIEDVLNPRVVEADRYSKEETLLPKTGSGVAQGSVISPLLTNIYLMNFDRGLEKNGILAMRYADDILVAARNKTQAKKLMPKVASLLKKHSSLEFHPVEGGKGPKINNVHVGLEFLGVYMQKTEKGNQWCVRPSDDKISEQKRNIAGSLSPRKRESLYSRIDYLNRSIASWFGTYTYAGCTKREIRKIYAEFKRIYTSQVNHLLRVNRIAKKELSREQMEFLGVLPPNLKTRKRRK